MVASAAMLLVGLTGGIGSGKSSVSARLREHGAVVIDADAITRELQEPGTDVFTAMVDRFGAGIVAPDGTLERRAVADVVFNDPEALGDLNNIVHPAVGAEIARRLEQELETDHVVVLDVPLLVESGRDDLVGLIVVDTDPEIAVQRLVEQRGFREADARARIARQASREDRLARADFVISNDGTREELERRVDECWAWLTQLQKNADEVPTDAEGDPR
jgi:dephospho-CoA kinase